MSDNLLDGLVNMNIPAFAPKTNILVGLAISEILGTKQHTIIRQYTDEERAAIMELYDMDSDCAKAFIKIELTEPNAITGKVGKKVVQHWHHIDKTQIAPTMSIWAYLSPLDRSDLESHINKPNCIVGIVPFRFGLAVADIDKPEMEAVEAVNDALGTPISTFATASGGWHSLYAIDGIQTASDIKATGYVINGEHLGEICCLHRFANCWAPVNWLNAVKQRLEMSPDAPVLTTDIINEKIVFMGKEKKRRKPKDIDAPKSDRTDTFNDLVSHYQLSETDTGEYQGHCPECDTDKSGGGTRFKARLSNNGDILLNCFACSPNGFDDFAYGRILRNADGLPSADISFLHTDRTT